MSFIKILLSGLIFISSIFSIVSTSYADQSYGKFRGKVVVEWLKDKPYRSMKLLKPFEYIGPKGVRWRVPKKTVIDGASIPRVFWTIIGSPFEGTYREPSVVHDFYCEARNRPYEKVHQMFCDAMLASGTRRSKAFLMCQAVKRFGPRWTIAKVDPSCAVVTDDYDFERCAQNSAKPDIEWPEINKTKIADFVSKHKGELNAADVKKLLSVVD